MSSLAVQFVWTLDVFAAIGRGARHKRDWGEEEEREDLLIDSWCSQSGVSLWQTTLQTRDELKRAARVMQICELCFCFLTVCNPLLPSWLLSPPHVSLGFLGQQTINLSAGLGRVRRRSSLQKCVNWFRTNTHTQLGQQPQCGLV